MIHADTDGLLDRCQCGAVGQVEESYNDSMEFRATCTECDSKTWWFPTKDGATTEWNQMQRRAKKKQNVR